METGEGAGRRGGDAPPGRRRRGLGASPHPEEEAEAGRTALAGVGAQGETPGGGEIETDGIAGDLGDDRRGAGRSERLLEGPQGFFGTLGGDLDEAGGIEAEEAQAGGMEAAGLAPRLGGGDPDEAAVAPVEQARQQSGGKAGEAAGVAAVVTDDLVQGAEGEAAGGAETGVERG